MMCELMTLAYGQYLPIFGKVPHGTYQKYKGNNNIGQEIKGKCQFHGPDIIGDWDKGPWC